MLVPIVLQAQLQEELDDPLREHLTELHHTLAQPEDMLNHLRELKKAGFEPKVIYDIGACVLHWTKEAKKIWPEATFIIFDAFDKPEFLYKEGNYQYHMAVLSNVDGKEIKFYQNDYFPGGNSYFREIGSTGDYFPEQRYRTTIARTLESVVRERGFPPPDLIKIDVQGAERDILEGGWSVINQAKYMIIEMQHTNYNDGAPTAEQTLPWIESHGWNCVAPLFSMTNVDGDYGFVRVTRGL